MDNARARITITGHLGHIRWGELPCCHLLPFYFVKPTVHEDVPGTVDQIPISLGRLNIHQVNDEVLGELTEAGRPLDVEGTATNPLV